MNGILQPQPTVSVENHALGRLHIALQAQRVVDRQRTYEAAVVLALAAAAAWNQVLERDLWRLAEKYRKAYQRQAIKFVAEGGTHEQRDDEGFTTESAHDGAPR